MSPSPGNRRVVAIDGGPEWREVIHRGPKSIVFLGPRSGLVTKLYHDTEVRRSRAAAEVEFERAIRAHRALAAIPGASCARPLEVVRRDGKWGIVLEHMAGRSLLSFALRGPRPSFREVGTRLGEGVAACCRTLGAPCYGLKPQDVLYDEARRRVVLLDFEPALAERWAGDPGEWSPVAASFGILLGMSLHYLTSPRRVAFRGGRRWLLDVIGAAAGFAGRREGGFSEVDLEILQRLSYRACRRKGNRWTPRTVWRPLWYGVMWQAVGRPGLGRMRSHLDV